MAGKRITKENWNEVFERIMNIVGKNLADPDSMKAELEDYLVSEESESDRMDKLFYQFLSVQEKYRDRDWIRADLKDAGATKADLEWLGYDDYEEEEET